MRKTDYYDTPEGRASVKKQLEQDEHVPPEECGYFKVAPDRYYLAMWCVPLPPWGYDPKYKGGCLTMLTWRKNEEPAKWHLRMCFRYFAKSPDDPWDGQDKKSWKGAVLHGTEKNILDAVARLMDGTGMNFNPPEDVLWIRGDDKAFYRAVKEQRPPWLHMRTSREENE